MDEPEDSTELCSAPSEVTRSVSANDDLVPMKSSKAYEAAYKKFIKWCEKEEVQDFHENALLAYFSELSHKFKWKSSTLWSQYSMVRSMLSIKHDIDISKYKKLRLFLKKQNETFSPKESRILTKEQFDKFLCDAPDEIYLGMKVCI